LAITRFTRQEFLDLIWSKPMRSVAADLGLSDVAVRKATIRAELPIPPQGHWNRVLAGRKSLSKPQLPPRGFGESDEIQFGSEDWHAPKFSEETPLPAGYRENDVRAGFRRRSRPADCHWNFGAVAGLWPWPPGITARRDA